MARSVPTGPGPTSARNERAEVLAKAVFPSRSLDGSGSPGRANPVLEVSRENASGVIR